MLPTLKKILDIQELDIKMIRLMRMKRQRLQEIQEIESVGKELVEQKEIKEKEIQELQASVDGLEEKIAEQDSKIKELEAKQSSIKKVDEFNALTQEMTAAEREKIKLEQDASNFLDKKSTEEEILEKIKESILSSSESSQALRNEIDSSIKLINEEGRELKEKRDALVQNSDSELLKVYERLLRNKRDRVIVPVENRTCSGCHVGITIQQENQVRKGSSIVHCEHCSRILYWPEEITTETSKPTRTRRRRTVTT